MLASLLMCIIVASLLTSQQIEINEYIADICEQYEVCPELVQAMVETESNYNVDAVNGDCKGLMQISEKWHKERMGKLDITDIYQPYCNILLGVDYLAELTDQYQDIGLVLMMYNMKHDKALELYEKGELSSYAEKILKRSAELENLHGK